jgi:hypothetical protein
VEKRREKNNPSQQKMARKKCGMQAHGGTAAMIRSPLRLSENLFTTMAIWVYTTRYFVGDFRNNFLGAGIFLIENQMKVDGADDPSRRRSRRLYLKARSVGKNAGATKEGSRA